MYILVIEDDKKVAGFLKKGLQEEGYTVDAAYDGQKGLEMATVSNYDLIILDFMLPQKDGIEFLNDLRKGRISVPVLMVTARDFLEDKIQGLDGGADDYLTKPFAFAELLARVRALLRRGKSESLIQVSE